MTLTRIGWGQAAAGLLVAAASQAHAQSATTRGEVTKIDRDGSRVTLKHAEIKNLDMPPMTMIFHVADATMMQGLVVGERVRFAAERIEGRYTVTSLYRTP